MTLSARSMALHGLGLGALAMALQGLCPLARAAAPAPIGGGWYGAGSRGPVSSAARAFPAGAQALRRARLRREDDLLFMGTL